MNTPGYHIASNGAVYSDNYSYDYLKKIGRKIKFSFYTLGQFVHMFKKCFQIKFFTFSDAGALIMVMPKVIAALIKRDIEKGRFKDSVKRVVGKNA
jgi:hypothetical protein